MSKRNYFHFRIAQDEKERWQLIADKEFDGALAKLIRAAVTGYININNQDVEYTIIMEKLDLILHKLSKNEIVGFDVKLVGESDEDPKDHEIQDETEISYQEAKESSGRYDF